MLQNLLNNFVSSIALKKQQFIFPKFRAWKIEDWEVIDVFQGANVIEGMLLLSVVDQYGIHLYTPDADYLGVLIDEDFKEYKDSSQYKDLLSDLKKGIMSVTVKKINHKNDDMRLDLQIS